MKKILIGAITLASVVSFCYPNGIDQLKLKEDMRKLWSDHVVWTRLYIIDALLDLPETKDTANRLLKNQDDLGNSIIPFYGEKAGKELTKLLEEHILIAVDLVKAAKAKDNTKVKAINDKWHKNAKDIANFLSKANPNWSEKDLTNMLNDHLKLTIDEAVLRLSKKWKEDIDNFDKIFEQALHMADDLSGGIIKQFPEKFNLKKN